jgi:hypothetical protein
METKRHIGRASSPEGAKRSEADAKRLDGDGPMWSPTDKDV